MADTPGRLLGIDHGIKRIGLAISDATRLIAKELTIITRESRKEDFEKINTIAAEHDAAGIIVGLPNNPSAPPDMHTQADTVRLWVERFAATTCLPILLWDEQMTSEDAVELAIRQKRKKSDPIDDLAARLILQSYLDAHRDGLAPDIPPPN